MRLSKSWGDYMESKKNESRGGFSYHVTEEQIRAYRKMPIDERLRWLEEALEFMVHALPPDKWEILQKFRRGEI